MMAPLVAAVLCGVVACGAALEVASRRRAVGASLAGGACVAGGPSRAVAKFYDSAAYDRYAGTYDALDGGGVASALGLEAARAALLAGARGRVLEVGAGTGLNVPFYAKNADVSELDLVDASRGMLDALRGKVAALGMRATARLGDATQLAFAEAGAYDTVVDTFGLCVYDDPSAALREMRRVVKRKADGGAVLLLENSRPGDGLLGAYVDLTADFVAKNGGKGCRYNQDVAGLARAAGFTVEREDRISGGFFRALVLTRP